MNDNRPPARVIPIIGTVGKDGRVTIIDPTWKAKPRPAPRLVRTNDLRGS